MIQVFTFTNKGYDDQGKECDGKEYVDFGIDTKDGSTIIMPQIPVSQSGLKWDGELGYHIP